MQGESWEQAVDAAVMRPDIYPSGMKVHDRIGQMIWRGYADGLKRLHTKQLEKFLKWEFGDDLPEDKLRQMIEIMFNGRDALSKAQQKEYDRIQKELAELKERMKEEEKTWGEPLGKLDEKRKEFRAKALKCCFDKSREDIFRTINKLCILEAYQKWCEDPNSEEARPRFVETYGERSDVERFCLVLCKLKESPDSAGCKSLISYIEMLIRCNCGNYPCDKLEEPCDPECEDCTKRTPPTAKPEKIVIEPNQGRNEVDTVHFITIKVFDASGNPVSDVLVSVTQSGANPGTIALVTDSQGEAGYYYTGEKAGTDIIVATAGDLSATATFEWYVPDDTTPPPVAPVPQSRIGSRRR